MRRVSVRSCILGAVWAAVPAAAALAQTPADLFQPYPDGGPLASRRFEPAAAFGNPPGFGAGRSGFDSTNMRGKSRRRQAAAPVPAGDPRPPPYVSRPGASVLPPENPAAEPAAAARVREARRRREESDPFDPLGLRIGTFIVKPAVELSAGRDSNPPRTLKGKPAALLTIAPELRAESDWARHALRAEFRGAFTRYDDQPSQASDSIDLKAAGRIDISSRTRADAEGRVLKATSAPGDPNTPAGVVTAPVYTTTSAAAGLTHRFNRLEVSLKATTERTVYEPSQLVSGAILDNADRNVTQVGGLLRGSYEITPGVKPFVEFGHDRRRHDRQLDSLGLQRDSGGTTFRAGTTFELTRKLTGEISAGYLERRYADPALQNLRGLIADASLVWTATALTTVTLTAQSTAEETTLLGVSGILKRGAALQVDHSLRRWLIASAKLSYGLDIYEGAAREDERMLASAALVYKANRNVQVKAEIRREWLRSNEPLQDYTANVFLAGLRFQI